MAVTHADLEPNRGKTDLSSKTGAFLTVLTILLGLFCFILCLLAEATRSQVTWISTSENGKGSKSECVYSGSGKMPLLCAACAFIGLAIAMLVEHTFMLIAVSNSPPALLTCDSDSAFAKSLTWQASFFFITTWICFAVGEILLLVGVSVESGHLKNWSKARPTCLSIGEGLFSAAGVFALTTVFLACGLYITALRALRILSEVDASSSVRGATTTQLSRLTSVDRENPATRESPLSVFPTPFNNKSYSFV
ncbi:uncharacterized protein LOC113848431 [Abrus precatorius]|uniref:Uncharacterized protein LOC113848431 n=1 Tax=Abrus precatorius TaxID=3816 RepID=A0A8B8JR13_ABRPR|nr:uncharacterized protein LOC113848431 [Abrus precatorius]